jgi:hypothetical protein
MNPNSGWLTVLFVVSASGCQQDSVRISSTASTVVATATQPDRSSTIASLFPSAAPVVAGANALFEAVLFPDQPDTTPQRISVVLNEYHGATIVPWQQVGTLISEDTQVYLEAIPRDEGFSVATFSIDTGKPLARADVFDDPPCPGERQRCDQRRVRAMIRKANAMLHKHRWVRLRSYELEPRDYEGKRCERDLGRHFRIEGYEVRFTPPHLRVVRQKDGLVVAERDLHWGDDQTPSECRHLDGLALWGLSFDAVRRLMVLDVGTCDRGACKARPWAHFVRLPQ